MTLPKKLRDALDLTEGQTLRVIEEGGRIVLEPERVFDAQLAADLKQGLEDIKRGKFIEFSSIEEMHEKMEKYEG